MHNMSEMEVIRVILDYGRKGLHRVSGILRPEHFSSFELAEVYRQFLKMDAEGMEITPGSLVGCMAGRLTGEMKVVLAEAAHSVSSLSAAALNSKAIADRWKMEQAFKAINFFGAEEYDDVSEYIARYAEMLSCIAGSGDDKGLKPWADVCDRALDEMLSPINPKRIFFGLEAFDRILGGSDPTDLILIAARPAVGKTALKEQIVRNLARSGKKILNVSLEMPDTQIAERQAASLSGVSLSDIRNRVASKGAEYEIEREKIETAVHDMRSWDIDVYDTPGLTVGKLSSIARMKRYDVIVVDYGGLMRPDSRGANRQEEMAAVSRGLRGLALGLRVQVIVLMQLNRAVEQRSSNRVMMADLRETGQWEQDAVQIIGMSQCNEDKILLEVLKNRNGGCGKQVLHFDKPRMRFLEVDEQYEEPTAKKLEGMR